MGIGALGGVPPAEREASRKDKTKKELNTEVQRATEFRAKKREAPSLQTKGGALVAILYAAAATGRRREQRRWRRLAEALGIFAPQVAG